MLAPRLYTLLALALLASLAAGFTGAMLYNPLHRGFYAALYLVDAEPLSLEAETLNKTLMYTYTLYYPLKRGTVKLRVAIENLECRKPPKIILLLPNTKPLSTRGYSVETNVTLENPFIYAKVIVAIDSVCKEANPRLTIVVTR